MEVRMDGFRRFLEESPIAAAVELPAAVVIRRLKLSPDAISGIAERGTLEPEGGEVCELEVGGQCLARGRIVRKRGMSYFKVTRIDEGGAR
jgi:hypothetical protein